MNEGVRTKQIWIKAPQPIKGSWDFSGIAQMRTEDKSRMFKFLCLKFGEQELLSKMQEADSV
jgi:hypothetical protein